MVYCLHRRLVIHALDRLDKRKHAVARHHTKKRQYKLKSSPGELELPGVQSVPLQQYTAAVQHGSTGGTHASSARLSGVSADGRAAAAGGAVGAAGAVQQQPTTIGGSTVGVVGATAPLLPLLPLLSPPASTAVPASSTAGGSTVSATLGGTAVTAPCLAPAAAAVSCMMPDLARASAVDAAGEVDDAFIAALAQRAGAVWFYVCVSSTVCVLFRWTQRMQAWDASCACKKGRAPAL